MICLEQACDARVLIAVTPAHNGHRHSQHKGVRVVRVEWTRQATFHIPGEQEGRQLGYIDVGKTSAKVLKVKMKSIRGGNRIRGVVKVCVCVWPNKPSNCACRKVT